MDSQILIHKLELKLQDKLILVFGWKSTTLFYANSFLADNVANKPLPFFHLKSFAISDRKTD